MLSTFILNKSLSPSRNRSQKVLLHAEAETSYVTCPLRHCKLNCDLVSSRYGVLILKIGRSNARYGFMCFDKVKCLLMGSSEVVCFSLVLLKAF